MFLALILGGGVFALIAWLVFNFSVYALPFFVGLTAARLAFATGAGFAGAGVIGLFAGGVSFGLGHFAFTSARSTQVRLAVAAVFSLPAGIAGYASAYGIVQLCVSSGGWRQVFALAGGLTIAAIAYRRLAAFAPLRVERDLLTT